MQRIRKMGNRLLVEVHKLLSPPEPFDVVNDLSQELSWDVSFVTWYM